jgi:mono/diheme cytochrome c family protein
MFSILLYAFAGLFLLWMILLSLGMRRMWVNVVLFALEATLVYTIIGNLVPQIESRPQAELQLSPDATPEQLVKAGEQLFYGKGTCALCHSIDPSEAARCPQLGAGPLGPAIGTRAEERVKEAGYKGKAKDGTDYLIESLTHPQDYLVQGFPPIMPVINKPPISLNNDEIAAVAAFLQSVQGGKVTVTPKMVAAFTGTEAPAQPGTAVAQAVVATAINSMKRDRWLVPASGILGRDTTMPIFGSRFWNRMR